MDLTRGFTTDHLHRLALRVHHVALVSLDLRILGLELHFITET